MGDSIPQIDLRSIPIPTTAGLDTTHRLLIPVATESAQNQELLCPVHDYRIAGEAFYARTDQLNAPYYRAIPGAQSALLARRGVCERLAQVNSALVPYGVELFVLDAYRSHETQTGLWEFFIEEARRILGDVPFQELVDFAVRYCSDPRHFDPSDPATWFVHGTGGAVDLTLVRRGTREQLFMGSIFDDPAEESHTAHFEMLLNAGEELCASENEALRNRRLLFHAMRQAGFTSYAFEWWHFDFGTQLWALGRKQSGADGPHVAFYGMAKPSL